MTLPDHVAALFDSGAPVEVIRNDEDGCYLRTAGIELRFVRSDTGWEFDEVVGDAHVHVEQMDTNWYWAEFATDLGRVCISIGAKRAPVTMRGWSESP